MTDNPIEHPHEHGHGLGEGIYHGTAHVMSPVILLGTFAALIVLTILTVVLANMNLGEIDIWVAMGIATVKAGLVALYFMHLRYEKPFNTLLFVFGFFFAALFLGAALVDRLEYEPAIQEFRTTQESLEASTP